jgi:SAM-dependent methyltransferase
MDVGYFDKLWPKRDDSWGAKSASWDSRADEFNSKEPDERIEKITCLLIQKKLLQADSSVLDIGCGPGKFACAFAEHAASVVGVDISPKMLQYARKNREASGLKNIAFKELDWEKADLSVLSWKKKFSLVVGIMSPAFCSKESLAKMMEASSEHCFICHFVGRRNLVEAALNTYIFGGDIAEEYGNRLLYCSLNMLWLAKCFPEIVYFNTERERIWPLAEAYKRYVSKLEMKWVLTDSQRTDIWNFLERNSENGSVREKVQAKIACIFWRNSSFVQGGV